MVNEPDREAHVLRDIPALVEFAEVARWQHITRAAIELGVPQPTLSRRIARLEAAVGVPLFVRRGRRVETTRAGREFAVTVGAALGDLERAVEKLRRDADRHTGTVTLAFLNTLGVEVVPRILREFRDLRPQIRFQLVQEGHDAAVGHLRAGEVDLCLTSPLPREAGLTSRALHEQPLRLNVPDGHRLSAADGVHLADLGEEQFIGFKSGYGMRNITDDLCRQAGFVPALAFEGEDVATVRGLVAAGLGVALLPVSSGRAQAGVVEVPLRTPAAARTIGMAWLTDQPASPPVTAFREFLLRRGPALVGTGESPETLRSDR